MDRAPLEQGDRVFHVGAGRNVDDLKTRRPSLHLVRGILLVLTNSVFFFALIAMPSAPIYASGCGSRGCTAPLC